MFDDKRNVNDATMGTRILTNGPQYKWAPGQTDPGEMRPDNGAVNNLTK